MRLNNDQAEGKEKHLMKDWLLRDDRKDLINSLVQFLHLKNEAQGGNIFPEIT